MSKSKKYIKIGCSEYPHTIFDMEYELGQETAVIVNCDFFAERKFVENKIVEKQMLSMKKEVRAKLNMEQSPIEKIDSDYHHTLDLILKSIIDIYPESKPHLAKYQNDPRNAPKFNFTIMYPINYIKIDIQL